MIPQRGNEARKNDEVPNPKLQSRATRSSADWSFGRAGNPRLRRGDSQSLTVPGVVRRAALTCVLFPLTPALSLGERGNLFGCFGTSDGARFVDGLTAILPLPEGEGRGEGEGNARSTHPVRIGHGVRFPPEGLYGFEPFIISGLRLCQRSRTALL